MRDQRTPTARAGLDGFVTIACVDSGRYRQALDEVEADAVAARYGSVGGGCATTHVPGYAE
jgi:hypothetical protein